MTFVSGSWAAVAGDFIQVLILMPVTVVAAFLAIRQVGGVPAFVRRLPAGHLDLSTVLDSKLMLIWAAAILIKQFISTNNILEASRYLCVKDGAQARKAALLAAVLFLIGPVVWFLPPMASSILYPNLHAMFPHLQNPAEGAFVAVCVATMPAGMIGLLLSGIFSATMSSMDTGLNRNAGIFVKNFYQPVIRPKASEAELVRAGRWSTAVLGGLIIVAAVNFSQLKGLGLFNLMLEFGTLVAVPYALPLVLGAIVSRTPPWAGWSTTFLCFAVSLLTVHWFGPDWLAQTLHRARLSPADAGYWTVAIGLAANVVIGTAWFLISGVFWSRLPGADRQRIADFDRLMRTPVDFTREMGAGSDTRQSGLLGMLCLVYGAFILLLALIPNPLFGRLGFLFCGGVVVLVGVLLRRAARHQPAAPAAQAAARG